MVEGVAASSYVNMLGSEQAMHAMCFLGRALWRVSPRFVKWLHTTRISEPLMLGIGSFLHQVRLAIHAYHSHASAGMDMRDDSDCLVPVLMPPSSTVDAAPFDHVPCVGASSLCTSRRAEPECAIGSQRTDAPLRAAVDHRLGGGQGVRLKT